MKIIITSLLAISVSFCSSGESTRKINPLKPFLSIEFAFNTSSYHSFIKKFYPQISVWYKSDTGEIETIYVTSKGAKDDWFGADKRPSALPVWRFAHLAEKNKKIDSISGATPSGSTYKIDWNLPDSFNQGKSFDIFIEANISFDYNRFYPKNASKNAENFSGVNGQPSLVWRGKFKSSKKNTTITPTLVGHGSLSGTRGGINSSLSKITTAKNIFKYIKIEYHTPVN